MSCQCWTCVPQGTVQVIQQWGKFLKFAEPGCHVLVPCLGHEIAGALSTRIQSLDVAVETKTKDNVFVTIIVSTQYMVLRESSRMYDAFYKLTDSREQIRSYIFDVVRSTVPRINLDDVFTTKEEIAMEVKSMLEKAMTEFGYAIIQTLVTDIAPDQNVKRAMNEINAAQRARVAAQDRAEADKIMVVKAAEADAESVRRLDERRIAAVDAEEAEMDRILAKINTNGLASLDEQERAVLDAATRRRRERPAPEDSGDSDR